MSANMSEIARLCIDASFDLLRERLMAVVNINPINKGKQQNV